MVKNGFIKKTNESFIVIPAFKTLLILLILAIATGTALSADTKAETKLANPVLKTEYT
jgi:hypothetical protein